MSLRERWRRRRQAAGEQRRREPIGLTVVPTEPEAEMICGLLRTNGIDCYYRRTDLAGAMTMYGGSALGPFEVLVPASDLAWARELIEPQRPEPDPGGTAGSAGGT